MLEIIKDYKKYILGGILLLIIFIGSSIFFIKSNHHEEIEVEEVNTEKVEVLETKEEEVIIEPVYFNVDIKGAVKKPGVYSLEEGSLVNDAIKMAGLKSNGTTKNINLSKKISDEMVIYVYTNKELNSKEEVITTDCVSNTVEITNCEGASIIVSDKTKEDTNNETEVTSSLVNINKASKEELMTLPGIGESKAIAIIKYREDNNGFKDITEIMNVSGIGEAVYNKIKDSITI